MGLFLLIQRYLDKQNDIKFVSWWERYVISSLRRFLFSLFVLYIGVMVLVGYLVGLVFGFFLTWLLVVLLGIYIGYDLVIETLKFLANNNQRYFMIKAGGSTTINNDGFSKDNVVN